MTGGLVSSEGPGPSESLVDAAGLPGIRDGFERLWTPHRAAYVSGAAKPDKTGECPFCVAPSLDDAEALVVARGRECFALLNLYPYNSGHIFFNDTATTEIYTDLTDEERIEMGRMTARAMEALGGALRPAGFNLGMNQGDVAGAGIAAHIHQHIVPRWLGDANFLPIVAQTKAIPAILADTRKAVSEAWSRIDRGPTGEGSLRADPIGEDPAGEEGSGNAQ